MSPEQEQELEARISTLPVVGEPLWKQVAEELSIDIDALLAI